MVLSGVVEVSTVSWVLKDVLKVALWCAFRECLRLQSDRTGSLVDAVACQAMRRQTPDSMVRGFGEGVKPRRRAGPARVTVLPGFLDSRAKRRILEGGAFGG